MSLVDVTRATADDGPAWDGFVRDHADATVFHRADWTRAVVDAYRHRDESLIARHDGVVVGVLPLVAVKIPLLGTRLLSAGFAVGGGPLAAHEDARMALLAAAEMRCVILPSCRLEVRSDVGGRRDWERHEGRHAGFPACADRR